MSRYRRAVRRAAHAVLKRAGYSATTQALVALALCALFGVYLAQRPLPRWARKL